VPCITLSLPHAQNRTFFSKVKFDFFKLERKTQKSKDEVREQFRLEQSPCTLDTILDPM
jgi:hypothetical protein